MSSSSNSSTSSGGLTFGGALALLFIGLKLGGVIDWPWIWVLSPLWISAALGLLIVAGIVVAALVAVLRPSNRKRRVR